MSANAFAAAAVKPISAPDALAALTEIMAILAQPEAAAQLVKAKAMAGMDVMMLMMSVIPLASTTLAPVLAKYGYAENGGVMGFLSALKAHAGDAQISDLARQMKLQFLPSELEPLITMMMAGPAAAPGGGRP